MSRSLGKTAGGFEPIGQIQRAIERRHRFGRNRMLRDRIQNTLVANAERFAGDDCAQPRMQNDRMGSLERVDRHTPLLALAQQLFRGVQPGKVVKHSGQTGLLRIQAVALREQLRAPRDANGMRVTMMLPEVRANVAREFRIPQPRYRCSERDRSARRRLRKNSPLRLPAHMTSAFSLLSL